LPAASTCCAGGDPPPTKKQRPGLRVLLFCKKNRDKFRQDETLLCPLPLCQREALRLSALSNVQIGPEAKIYTLAQTFQRKLIRSWRRTRREPTRRRLVAPDAPPQQQPAHPRQRDAEQPVHSTASASPRVCLQGVRSTQRCAEERQKRFEGQFSAFSLRLRAFASRWVTLQPDAYRSSGCSPVRLATRANMRGPISS
jgi:hypothetical protein